MGYDDAYFDGNIDYVDGYSYDVGRVVGWGAHFPEGVTGSVRSFAYVRFIGVSSFVGGYCQDLGGLNWFAHAYRTSVIEAGGSVITTARAAAGGVVHGWENSRRVVGEGVGGALGLYYVRIGDRGAVGSHRDGRVDGWLKNSKFAQAYFSVLADVAVVERSGASDLDADAFGDVGRGRGFRWIVVCE